MLEKEKRKKERLEVERGKKEAKELDGCTFKPKLIARHGSGDNRVKSVHSELHLEKVEKLKKSVRAA